jgi:predicted Zn-dependent protease
LCFKNETDGVMEMFQKIKKSRKSWLPVGFSVVWPIAFVTLFLAACQAVNTTAGGTVGIDRTQYMAVSSRQVEQSSAKSYLKTLQEENGKGNLNTDAAQVKRIRAIASRIIPQTGVFRPDAPRWAWEVNVISSKNVNAWCMAGGKIAFYTGLLDTLKLSDDEVAAVMGHEIAHALREHSRERASEQMITQLGVAIGGAVLGFGQLGNDALSKAVDLTLSLPHSRQHETEADRIGVELSARAGYNPEAAVTLWEKMGRLSESRPPELLSTHPAPESRIEALKRDATLVYPLYQAASKVR